MSTQDSQDNCDSLSVRQQKQQRMLERLSENFQRNSEALQKYEPDLFRIMANYQAPATPRFTLSKSDDANLYLPRADALLYPADNPREYCRALLRDSLKERRAMQVYFAREKEKSGQIHFRYINDLLDYQHANLPRSITPAESGACPVITVAGVGLGYILEDLCSFVDFHTLIIVEPEMFMLYASLYTCDWARILEKLHGEGKEIVFFPGLSGQKLKSALTSFYMKGHMVLADYLWVLRHYDGPLSDDVTRQISDLFNELNKSIGFFDSRMFALSQSLRNVAAGCRFVRNGVTLPYDMAVTPLCVVANGPSLSNDLPYLRQVQNKVYILACGTALETLYRAGIRPHFYAAVERLKQIADVISLIPDQEYTRNLILLSPDVIHPETAAMFDHTALFLKEEEPFADYLMQERPDLRALVQEAHTINPLVGNMGLSAACTLGFRNILMFGTDNGSSREDRREHPDESVIYNKIFSDKNRNVATEDQKVNELSTEVPGNFRAKVYSNYFYMQSAHNMGLRIAEAKRHGFCMVYNCSDGMRIEGALPAYAQQLPEACKNLPETDREKLYALFDGPLTVTLDLTDEDRAKLTDKGMLHDMADRIRRALHLEDPLKDLRTRCDVTRAMIACCKELESMRTGDERRLINFLNGSVLNFLTLTQRAMYLSAGEEEGMRNAERHLRNIGFFLEDAERLFALLPDYCENDHRRHLAGKIGFDHKTSPAPALEPYVSPVTQKDRDSYPVRKFRLCLSAELESEGSSAAETETGAGAEHAQDAEDAGDATAAAREDRTREAPQNAEAETGSAPQVIVGSDASSAGGSLPTPPDAEQVAPSASGSDPEERTDPAAQEDRDAAEKPQ